VINIIDIQTGSVIKLIGISLKIKTGFPCE